MSVMLVFHVGISLVGVVAGFVVAQGFLSNRLQKGWNALFLATTIATSVSGFLLPADRFLPSHAFGIISLVVLGLALLARYVKHESGRWRATYRVNALIAFYLNLFVLIVQMFLKVPFLKALAPTQTELPFALAQLALLVAFLVVTVLALKSSRNQIVPNVVTQVVA